MVPECHVNEVPESGPTHVTFKVKVNNHQDVRSVVTVTADGSVTQFIVVK